MKTACFEYIDVFYNRKRQHSTLGYRSPIQYLAEQKRAAARGGKCKQSHFKKKPTFNQLAGLPTENKILAMFKLATKVVKVDINLWALAAILQVLISWVSC